MIEQRKRDALARTGWSDMSSGYFYRVYHGGVVAIISETGHWTVLTQESTHFGHKESVLMAALEADHRASSTEEYKNAVATCDEED